MLAARQVVTLFLIATLIPAPGLAWPAPAIRRTDRGAWTDAYAHRVFLHALNSTEQSPMSGPNRPQLYLVFNVDVAVPPSGPEAAKNAVLARWNEIFKEVEKGSGPAVAAAPTAAASPTETEQKLAKMPDAIKNGELGAKFALDDALTAAGIDVNTRITESDDGKTAVYEEDRSDGDIKVTATLDKDGKTLLLTKEFTPLATGGGVQNGGTLTLADSTVSGNTAPPASTGAVYTPAPTSPAAPRLGYSDMLRIEYEHKVNLVEDRDDAPPADLMGLILTRDTYATQLNSTAERIQNVLDHPESLAALTKDLRGGAKAVDDAYVNMLAAEHAAGEAQNRVKGVVNLENQYHERLKAAQDLENKGDAAGAATVRQEAHESAYGNYIYRRNLFYSTLDQNPLLGLGTRNVLLPDDFLFKTLYRKLPVGSSDGAYVELVRPYLEEAAEEARDEATRITAITEEEDFLEFGGPKYERTRETIGKKGDANGSSLPRALVTGAEGYYASVEGSWAIYTEVANFGLNLVAGAAWVIPVVGPAISLGAAAIQVVRDGNDLVIAVLDEKDAQNLAMVTGYTRVLTAEEKVAMQKEKFAVSVAGLAVEGLQGVRIVKGPVKPGAGNTATGASMLTNTTTDATGAVRATPATTKPVGAAAPPAAPAGGRSPSPFWDDPALPGGRGMDGTNYPASTRISTAEEAAAAEAVELKEIYDANLARAKASGMSEERIKQIIGDGAVDIDAANTLYKEAIDAEGKNFAMPWSELVAVTGIDVRRLRGGLTEADYTFLRNQLAADPNYLDGLPNKGTFRSKEPGAEFDPIMTTAQRDALLQDPRVAQLVDEARKSAAAGTAGRTVATTTGSATPGAKPDAGPPRAVDPNRTVVDPGTTTIDPNATTLDANKTLIDPNKTVIDPNQTVITDPRKPGLAPPSSPRRVDPGTTTRDAGITTVDPNKTVIDPNQTVIMPRTESPLAAPKAAAPPAPRPAVNSNPDPKVIEDLMKHLTKVTQAGMSSQEAAADIRATAAKLGLDPQVVVKQMISRLSVPRPVSMGDLGNTATEPEVRVSMEALGVSSGVAFTIRTTNSGTMPIQVQGEGIVVEPVSGPPVIPAPVGERALQSRSANRSVALAAPPVATEQVEAFCLERERPVALAGTQYRVAPPALQAQHRGLVNVLHAAQKVMDLGGLRPDSEVKSYFTFIRQWSIWSRQENFDQGRFTDAFVDQTKKNVEGQGVKWTDVMRDTVRKAAPGRWRDIVAVLDAAKQLPSRASAEPSNLNETLPRDLRQVAVVRRFSPAPPRLRSVVI